MSDLHLECKPDEAIAKTLGKPARSITHHNDKGRIMKKLESHLSEQCAMVDEDPYSAKHSYERTLVLEIEKFGLKIFKDRNENKVVMLCPRLEEWLINVAIKANVDMKEFGLPPRANELHNVINQRLDKVKKLIDHLNQIKAPAIILLKDNII